jgi:dienelactone hydrolase
VPFLPAQPDVVPVFTEKGLRTDAFMDLARYRPADIQAAQILVERSAGPILLLSGDDDHQWPAAVMAAEIVQRMAAHGRGGDATSVVYPGAGHVFFVREIMPAQIPGPYDLGGALEADLAAGKDAWRRVLSFLQDAGPGPEAAGSSTDS